MEIILSILIPLALSFSGFLLISFNAFLLRLPVFLAIAVSTFFGLVTVLFPLIFAGLILPAGFSLAAKALFIISCLFSISGIYRYCRLKKISPVKWKKISKPGWTGIFSGVFILIYLLLFAARPIADADVTDSYLPLARSIVLSDHIPTHNYYNNRPFIIPPAGGPVLFAYYYAVEGNIFSDVFRFINVPFFLGFLILTYYIMREYFSSELAFLGVLTVLTMPLLEDMVFLSGLYPDFIFSFAACLGFYLMTVIMKWKGTKIPTVIFLSIGAVMALTFFLKYQALFLWIILGLILLANYIKHDWNYLLLPVIYVPWLLGYIAKSSPFQPPPQMNFIAFGLFLTLVTFLLLKKVKPSGIITYKNIISVIAIAAFSSILIVWTFMKYSGIEEKGTANAYTLRQEIIMGLVPEGGDIAAGWILFFAPSLAIYWFIPKVAGLWRCASKNGFILPLFISGVWYSYWVMLLGAVDVRWLFPIVPYFALIVIAGLKAVFKKSDYIAKIVYSGIPFMIVSSKFLFWNLGVLQMGTANFRHTASIVENKGQLPVSAHALVKTLSGMSIPLSWVRQEAIVIWQFAGKTMFILTSRTPLNLQDNLSVFIISLVFFALIMAIARFFGKLRLGFFSVILVIGFYFYIYWGISGGNLLAFGKNEENRLFDYWGQSTRVVPYLNTHSRMTDEAVVFSIPTGLAYYTGMKVYNLEYGGGLSVFYPIYEEKDDNTIYRYFKDKHIRYIIFRDYGDSIKHLKGLKAESRIFDFLDNPLYAKLVIRPDENNFWRVYELL